ncbi:MAG: flagellar basal body-associated FliL family protein [Gammaproteobacteria bacterium]|nr:flagellar basal body-associated FliL family protein [Gammaproteobacteria bacterium]
MAKKEKAEGGEVEVEGGGSSTKKLIIIMVVVMVVMMGATGAVVYFLFAGGEGAAPAPEAEEVIIRETNYVKLDTITANLIEKRPARHIQIEAEVMTYSPKVAELLQMHMPRIRNDLNNLLGAPSYVELRTAEGKEALRQGMLDIAKRVIKDQEGLDGVEAVYFTKFIMQ